jgi:hypothetical protein
MARTIKLSLCTFQNGTFDVMVKDGETDEEICFSGEKKLTDKELDMVNSIAPACVWTTYTTDQEF